MFLSNLYLMTSNYDPGARFSKAPETFRARKAIFSLSVSKNGGVFTLKVFAGRELLFILRICEYNSSVIVRFEILLWFSGPENFAGLSRNGLLDIYGYTTTSLR